MLRQVHVTAFNRVCVDVVQFFPHHRFVQNQFGMHTFLPELIFAILFMRRFGKAQPLEQALGFLLPQMIDDPARGIGFEAGDAFVQFRGLGNEVQMISARSVR
jgi:hypothetical protein